MNGTETPQPEMNPVSTEKPGLLKRLHMKKITISPLVVIIVAILAAGTVFAATLISSDSATFNSSINKDRPLRTHLLQVDGTGQLVANLEDTTADSANRVHYTLTMLDGTGSVLQQIMSESSGSSIQLAQSVIPGVYTFTVNTMDSLTETGASYQLSIQYPNDTEELGDTTAPTITIDSPARGAELSGEVTFSGSAQDDNELAQVTVRIDEGPWTALTDTNSWDITYDTQLLANGNHIIEVRATDAAGNETIESVPIGVFNEGSSGSGGDDSSGGGSDDGGSDDGGSDSSGGGNDDGGNSGGGSDTGNDSGDSTPPPSATSFSSNFVAGDWQDQFDFHIWHRDAGIEPNQTWLGDHQSTGPNDLCNSPDNKRTINSGTRANGFNDDWIYRCVPGGDLNKAHIMTSIGDVNGYSIGSFSPSRTFNGITEVRWDVNQTDLGDRQWTEVAVIPANVFDFDDMPCAVGLPCGTSTHADLGSVGTQWGGLRTRQIQTPEMPGGYQQALGSLGYRCDGCPYAPGLRFGGGYGVDDPALTSIQIRRTNYLRDNGNGTLTWGFQLENGTYNDFTVPGSFPEGDVRVVFKDHNYTPLKSPSTLLPETTFTWHWDNIEVR